MKRKEISEMETQDQILLVVTIIGIVVITMTLITVALSYSP